MYFIRERERLLVDKSSIQNQNARIKAELFIDEKWVEGEGKEPFIVLNPFDNSEICKIRPASPGLWSLTASR